MIPHSYRILADLPNLQLVTNYKATMRNIANAEAIFKAVYNRYNLLNGTQSEIKEKVESLIKEYRFLYRNANFKDGSPFANQAIIETILHYCYNRNNKKANLRKPEDVGRDQIVFAALIVYRILAIHKSGKRPEKVPQDLEFTHENLWSITYLTVYSITGS